MLEIIGKLFFVFLAILGAVEIVRSFIAWLLRPTHHAGKLYLVIPIEGHDEEAEMLLESGIEKLKWIRGEEKTLVCLDKGMDEETGKVCGIIANRNPGVVICKPEELANILAE
ncbi:hypothetical protein [Caproiciproducens galactitolivorans]|uniref:Uncharacterized protein n=1 Tax=Caproiciproducens galactitolivorans TaxID=642589 RepID=A0ABT4BTI9_9FIRM|nr:hypothetical protein [Caproiciproducens galactitolivorans]MCY1714204.1 hypothetical protein [Caproiciproducens galactitolivorans]